MERRTAKDAINGLMDLFTKEISRIMIVKDTAFTSGQMEEYTLVIGHKTKCMDREFSPGKTGECSKVNMYLTRRVAMGLSLGLMAENMKASGKMASSTVLGTSPIAKERSSAAFGRTVKE